jgi:hypothetical protein
VNDPFEVLGLTPTATCGTHLSERRRLAFDSHPDRGGDGERMRAVNVAFEAAVAHVTGRRLIDLPASAPTGTSSSQDRREPHGRQERQRWRVERDAPSFVIDLLPAEAFEALLIAAASLGEVLVDEPPYVLEAFLRNPEPCWCRLDLVPDAGASTISLTVAGIDGAAAPDPELVRDVWIGELNSL